MKVEGDISSTINPGSLLLASLISYLTCAVAASVAMKIKMVAASTVDFTSCQTPSVEEFASKVVLMLIIWACLLDLVKK